MKKLAFYFDEENVYACFDNGNKISSVTNKVFDPIKTLPETVYDCLNGEVPDTVITARGPASFTTVRILISFGLGFKSLKTVSNFDLLSIMLKSKRGCVAIDSRRRTFFVKFFGLDIFGLDGEENELSLEDLKKIVEELDIECISSSPLISFKKYTKENVANIILKMQHEDITQPFYFYTPNMKPLKKN